MAKGELIGCFGLTEPTAGSDPGGMTTYARRDGDRTGCSTAPSGGSGWPRSPRSRSSGRRPTTAIRGFVVPTDTPGFTATPIEPKLSMRASIQCDITLDDVRLPADAVLPERGRPQGPVRLPERGPVRDHLGRHGRRPGLLRDRAARTARSGSQFDKPLAGYQLTQRKLADMVLEIQKGILVALQTGRLKDAGTLHPQQISFGKLNNVREAIEICREARAMLGGNGITLDYSPLRHANNLESVRTYEGTDEVHTLIMGQAITGLAAFR